MSRIVVSQEGKTFPDGRHIKAGALIPKEGRIPVIIGPFWNSVDNGVGYAEDFQRDSETGEISYNITFTDHWNENDLKFMDLNVFSEGIEYVMEGDICVITKGIVRAICIILIPGFPKMD